MGKVRGGKRGREGSEARGDRWGVFFLLKKGKQAATSRGKRGKKKVSYIQRIVD
jgi:hypothetical protein